MQAEIWKVWITDDWMHDQTGYPVIHIFIPSLKIAISSDKVFKQTQEYYENNEYSIPSTPPELLKVIMIPPNIENHVKTATYNDELFRFSKEMTECFK